MEIKTYVRFFFFKTHAYDTNILSPTMLLDAHAVMQESGIMS